MKCYTMEGASERTIDLPAEWFDVDVNKHVLYQVTRAQRTNARAGTASTKTRAEVRGGGAKPWRQKGTGRARAGSIRSPLWPGGGVTFGPAPKQWRERVPRRVRQLAFASALTDRARNDGLRIVALEKFDGPKTARLARALERWDAAGKVLLLLAEADPDVVLSGRNLQRLTVKSFADASALDVLSHDVIVIQEGAWSTRVAPGAGQKPEDGTDMKSAETKSAETESGE